MSTTPAGRPKKSPDLKPCAWCGNLSQNKYCSTLCMKYKNNHNWMKRKLAAKAEETTHASQE